MRLATAGAEAFEESQAKRQSPSRPVLAKQVGTCTDKFQGTACVPVVAWVLRVTLMSLDPISHVLFIGTAFLVWPTACLLAR
jgi:hypothetical protein